MRNNVAFLRLVLVFILCILVEASGHAGDLFLPPTDSICEGNVLITTQAEWDLFASDYAGCATLVGDITIDNSLAEIDSVFGLDSVSVMVGDLVIEYAGAPFVFNTLNSLDSMAGDLSISNCPEYCTGLNRLHSADAIVLNNISVSDGTSHPILDGLIQCESITVQGSNLIYSAAFHNLQFCRTIEFIADDPFGGAFIILDSFSNLTESDSIIVQGDGTWVRECFQSLLNAEYIEIGGNLYMMGEIRNSFNSLVYANEISLGTYFKPVTSLNNLIEVHNITLLEYPDSSASTEPVLQSLERITGSAILALNRPEITFPVLESAGSFYLETSSDQYNVGPASIHLPMLTEINGNLTISTISLIPGQPDTSLQTFYAPLLTHVEGTITINTPALTSCISPAFCESVNYSPNWGDVIGGPGCSTVEEIQAQCEITTPNCEGDAFITTQAEWDLFAAENAGCISYVGDITIDNSLAEIDSLYGFEDLYKVIGNIAVHAEGTQITLRTFNRLDSIIGNLFISISENLYGFQKLKYVHQFTIENLADQSWETGEEVNGNYFRSFDSLYHCETISIINIGVIQNVLPSIFEVGSILIQAPTNAAFIGETLNALSEADSIVIIGSYIIDNSFEEITSVNYLEMGESPNYLTLISNAFESLEYAGSIHISTNEFAPSLSNLTHAGEIYIEEIPMNVGVNMPILSSLEEITGNAILFLCRDTIALNSLEHAGGLNFLTGNDYTNNLGVRAILLPQLTHISGDLFISTSSWSPVGDTSLQTFRAPVLNTIGGEIMINSAPYLTTCVSPAFCESANYSPNWSTQAPLMAGPGCSTVEEIQAQCVSICPDIDSNGICDSVQTVYIGDLEFTSTSEVQTFANAFPQVHKIIGDLTLLGYTGDALFETEALINLDTIQGQLQCEYSTGIAFSGFSNLRHVDTFIGDSPFYNYGITYNENDSTPIYSYCTNCFPSLISANKMHITSTEGNLVSSFNALERCDTLNIDCSRIFNGFNNLTTCKVLNFNTSYSNLFHHNPFDNDPWTLFRNILETNQFSCPSTLFNSFNQIDSVDCFFATDIELTQAFNLLQNCKTLYVNNVTKSQSLLNLSSCRNFFTYGNSQLIDRIENANTLNYIGVYSQETSINLAQLEKFNVGDFFLYHNTNLHLEELDTILSSVSFYPNYLISAEQNAENVGIYLNNLDFVGSYFEMSNLSITAFEISDEYFCEILTADNIDGIDSFGDVYINAGISIVNCPDFSQCNSQGICDYCSNNSGMCIFENNSPGCNSIQEVIIHCQGSTASGTVYYDLDCDQQFNNDDALVSYPILLQGDTLPIGSSGEAGYFFVPLELNNTTTLFTQHTADWSSNGPITLTTTDSLQVFTELQIGLCPVTIIHDVAVNVNASMNPRPGFTVRYNIVAQNLWPGSDSASVIFNIALIPGAVITGYASGGTQEGNQVSFTTNLQYGQSQMLWVDVLVPVGTPLGTAYTATATIALSAAQAVDSHPENNTYTLNQTVIGSYDPNDKLVTPAVIDLLDIDSTQTATIEYTIRFQNTGTAEAIFVRVLDTLSSALNPATFELIATSHPSEITFHDNHVIEWFFDNIMLPDSFSNEPGSHGYIQFRIQTLPLSAPTTLENEAAIYFDFNEPVITSPAVTAVVICAEAGDACDDGDACTTNDLIQPDCSCAGIFADADSDGTCDALDNCQGVPYAATPITDLNLTCASSIPLELPEFLMADNGGVQVSFTDSVLSGSGCNATIQRTYIAENTCGNQVYVAQFITTSDSIAPTLLNCPADTTINGSEISGYFAQPIAIDNCADAIAITFTEESLNCTTDSTVFELYTSDILLNNACNDPYPYSLSLHMQPIQHRIFRIDTTRAATMVDYHNGTVRFSGRFVNVLNNNAGFDFNFNFINGMNFLEWTTSHPAGFNADCGGSPENHADWMYYITENSPWYELQGWGEYTGSQIDIMHAPVSQYFGFQIGYGANSLETSYGGGTIYTYQGNFVLNGTTTSVFGPGNFRITIQDTTISQITRTWTATDCAGNSTSCTQIIQCINDTIDPGCSAGQACDDNNTCTLNDVIQTDCSCQGVFTDSDGDGICDAQDSCNEALLVLYADSDITIDCGNEVPDFLVVLSTPNGEAVDVEYRDSILFQTDCYSNILQLAIATNTCGDTAVVSRIITIEDITPPVFTACEQEITVTCDALSNTLSVPGVSDDCSSAIDISYTENCLDCTTDSTVYPCATPVRTADNPCGYPYDWSLALFNLPSAHRWYQVDTTVPATMTDYHDGTVTFRGRWVNVLDTSGGFDYEFTLEDGVNWTDWNDGTVPHGFLADCGGVDENHPDWMYYLLQSGAGFELQGWGTYAGSLMNITHAPSNQYFGHQIGLGANNNNAEYGMIGWANITGTLFVSGNLGATVNSACDIAFVMPSCAGHTSEVTWTASDCSGNTATCSQIIHFEPTFDQPECFVDNPCNDNDPCTIGDTYQADCSCLGSLLDNDNDGLCDLTAPCDGVIIGEPCNDLDPCTTGDIIQPDCSCIGTFADNDSDGICDAEDACDNTLAGAACDDEDPCTTNDLIQSDCSCAGTYTDADSDGICDAAEIAGCMDIEACNYNALATDDDGSCVYVESLTIAGNLTAMAGVSESYSYPGPASSSYQWSITPGTIQSGQGTTTVSVIWDDALLGTLQVTETNDAECLGSTVVLEVNITPNTIPHRNTESIYVYPNPASDVLHIAGDNPSNAQASISNGLGQCVYLGTLASAIDVRSLAAGVYYLRIQHNGTVDSVKFTIVRE